jgi:DNA polymerase-1
VARWYADRPEVRDWQARTRAYAAHHGWVNTMIGRRRRLPEINSSDR